MSVEDVGCGSLSSNSIDFRMIPKATLTSIGKILIAIPFIGFLLDHFTALDFKGGFFPSVISYGALLLPLPVLIWRMVARKRRFWKSPLAILSVLTLLVVLWKGPVRVMFSASPWRTQTITHQHRQCSFIRIEEQMRDVGALGYRRRTVRVIYLTPWTILAKPAGAVMNKSEKFRSVHLEVNELELNY